MSAAFLIVRNVGLFWLAAMWLGSARCVQRDAEARLGNPSGIRAAVAAALLLPFLGAFLWLCLRPAETRVERRQRRLARLALEPARDEHLGRVRDPNRLGPALYERPEGTLDLVPALLRRRRDEADREEAIDEPVRVDVLAVRQA